MGAEGLSVPRPRWRGLTVEAEGLSPRVPGEGRSGACWRDPGWEAGVSAQTRGTGVRQGSADQGKGDKWTWWEQGVKGRGATDSTLGGLSPSSAEFGVSGRGRAVLGQGVGGRGRVNNKGATGRGPVPGASQAPPRLAMQRTKKCSGRRHICRELGGEAMCVGRPGRPLRGGNTQHRHRNAVLGGREPWELPVTGGEGSRRLGLSSNDSWAVEHSRAGLPAQDSRSLFPGRGPVPLGKRGEGRTQFQGLAPESKINMPRTSGRAGWREEGGPAQEEPEQGAGAASPVVVSSGLGQGDAGLRARRGCWTWACWPPARRQGGGGSARREWPGHSALRWSCCH